MTSTGSQDSSHLIDPSRLRKIVRIAGKVRNSLNDRVRELTGPLLCAGPPVLSSR
jgi:hypothetical protein